MSRKVFITFEDAVEQLGLAPQQLKQWMAEGVLRGYRFHNTFSFKRDELDKLRGVPVAAHGVDLNEFFEGNQSNTPKDKEENEETVDVGRILEEALQEHPTSQEDEDTFLEPVGDGASAAIAAPSPSPGAAMPVPSSPGKTTKGEPGAETSPGADHSPRKPPAVESPAKESPPDTEHIRFYCPCGKRLKTLRKYIGQKVACSRCGQDVAVPSKSVPRPAPVQEAPAAQPLPRAADIKKAALESEPPTPLEGTEEADVFDTVEVPTPETSKSISGPEERERAIEEKLEEMNKKLENVSAKMADYRRQNDQIRFDIARLYDLVSRLRPTGFVPAIKSQDRSSGPSAVSQGPSASGNPETAQS